MAVFSIVLDAVIKHEIHIDDEVPEFQVLIRLELVLDRAEVHGLLDNVKVVWDVQLHRIHWFVEDPRLVVLPERVEQPLCSFVPRIVDLGLVSYLGNFKTVNRCRCKLSILVSHEVLCKFGAILTELGPLFITQRLILTIPQDRQLIALRYLPLIDSLLLRSSCCLRCRCMTSLLALALRVDLLHFWCCIVFLKKL